jgi:hypothetical protein
LHQLNWRFSLLGADGQNEAGEGGITYKHAGNFARFALFKPNADHRRRKLLIVGTGLSILAFAILVLFESTSFLLVGFSVFVLLTGIYVIILGTLRDRKNRNQSFSSPPLKVALIAVFTALALGTNYLMIDIPNVKLMDALVFIAAFLFGLEVGLGSAISVWVIYGFINPYGQAGFPLLFFLVIGESFYATAGVLLRRTSASRELLSNDRPNARMSLLFGLIGFQATFAYDVLTNFGSWMFTASSVYQAFVIGMITGAPFAIIHEVSNVVFFATVVPMAIIASKRMGLPIRGEA